MSSVIGEISCTPSSAVVGDSVLVEVHPATGESFNPIIAPTVHVNGVPGTHFYLQYWTSGPQTVFVQATGPSGPESKSVVVQVRDVPPPSHPVVVGSHTIQRPDFYVWPFIGIPYLQLFREPHQPYVIGFSVGHNSESAPDLPPSGLGTSQLVASPTPLVGLPHLTLPPPGKGNYVWYFGDGQSLNTLTPFTQHDYSNAIDPLVEHQSFDVTVGTTDGLRRVHRTVTFTNSYAMLARITNTLHPPAEPDGFARRTSTGFFASCIISNPEQQAMTLTRRRFVPWPSNSNDELVPAAVENIPDLVIPQGHPFKVSVAPKFDQVPRESVGFSVYLAGRGPGNKEVRVNAHFDLEPSQRPAPKVTLWEGRSRAFLDQMRQTLVQNNLLGGTLSQVRKMMPAATDFLTDQVQLSNDLHMLRTGNLIPGTVKPPAAVLPASLRHLQGPNLPPTSILPPGGLHFDPPPPVAVGNTCDPDNLPDNLPPGMVCQITTEPPISVPTPPRFQNAWKGHTILSPGGVGLVGQLLTKVDHPQKYSHCGIMTTNFDQITHCTASQDRLQSYPVGSIPLAGPQPTHGFRVDVVKYGWPGTMTQSVDACVNGEKRPDPETPGNLYNFADFNAYPAGATIDKQWQLVPQLVVKPDPFLEDDTIRRKLHAVADDAYAHNGKHHYRFYCYTDPTIVNDPHQAAPAVGQWQDGTKPGCCSSFIWEMMKRNGEHLAGAGNTTLDSELTDAQRQGGAKVAQRNPLTPDGLYLYSSKERLNAANFLHDSVLESVNEKIADAAVVAGIQLGGLVSGPLELFTLIRKHVPNEMVNFFARDSGTLDDDDEGWKNTVDANAVSPDNILLWNGPSASTPGPYGYIEPCRYTEGRVDLVPVSRWKLVQQQGTLTGRVTFKGAPVASATVSLGGTYVAGSDANGHYTIANVPYGSYLLKAQQVLGNAMHGAIPTLDSMLLTANVPVDIEQPSKTQDIVLLPPPATKRNIIFDGSIHIHYDYHLGPFPDIEDKDFPFHIEFPIDILNPPALPITTGISENVKTAAVSLNFWMTPYPDNSVTVLLEYRMHWDFAGPKKPFKIAADAQVVFGASELSLNADNDQAWCTLTVKNAQALA